MKTIKSVLVANRGEIAIRVFRACKELGIRSIAIYSEEDKNSLYRTMADESYQIGKGKLPVDAYLDIAEIIALAKAKGADAIHPGYGFLAENAEFAEYCERAGIIFIGPTHEMLNALGDKIQSKIVAKSVNVPTIPGVEKPALNLEEAREYANVCGYPVILKAAAGGGGRGMRVVNREEDLENEYLSACNEAKKAFGIGDVFVEKFIAEPKHIEVQVLGDNYGNLVHLFERDCSIQRRHQKVIEFAPSLVLTDDQREAICKDALKIAGAVNYRNAGTVEFLVDHTGQHYFIEMNPRIQVEHCVTEIITGIDVVQAQIRIADGSRLDSEEVGIADQDSIHVRGYAIQCRVTTEDPVNHFAPDTGTIEVYRSSSGNGIRLDSGNAYTGAYISPFYDSLLVKIIAYSNTFGSTVDKAIRCLREMKIKGVKTNIAFLINVLNTQEFRKGQCDTGFISRTPELFDIRKSNDKELKVLTYLANKVVNENKGSKPSFDVPVVPKFEAPEQPLYGTKQLLDEKGPQGLCDWVLDQKKLLITDTTLRDAHQSLVATRMRTNDMLNIAPALSVLGKDLFSLEMWGGATFDTAYRFLKEDPWDRLIKLREQIPNILFQMLFRGANAVGYKSYPDNVIRQFVQECAKGGIDIFRIFDSLNWIESMKVSIDEALKTDRLVEGCLCYTGDITDKTRTKYDLDYFVAKAKELEGLGCHMIGIKDMSALLKPQAAYELVTALKENVKIPIHLHTHDTTGNGVAALLMAAQAGVDIVDCAFNAMAGLTSQPALNSLAAALINSDRDTGLDTDDMQKLSDYWQNVRPIYAQFESGLKSGSAEIYKYEIPGGQYSNLKAQVESFGLGHQLDEVKDMYADVNRMLGDIVKVTPSSKAVGDMAIFMVQNGLTPDNIYEKGKNLDFPDSIVSYFEGMMGQPEGGFPPELQKIVLKDRKPITCRPGELLDPEDFEADMAHIREDLGVEADMREAVSYALYPKVYDDYWKSLEKDGDLSNMSS
ncbi:MAG: pyruvate carboxylase, partial [Peptococcus niger]